MLDTNYIQKAKTLSCCVIVPTYNNAATLPFVIADVKNYVDDIFVINDGSTDKSESLLKNISGIQLISYAKNRGKGYALKQGFKAASTMGFRYAITIDSDGQHLAKDIVLFLDKIETCNDSLIVGSRLLKQENMPGGNTFANRFSNFWFRLQTATNLPDTQSGFRIYPLKKIAGIHFFTNRYESELEMIVRSAWRGIKVCSIPISVYYPPIEERVSHFRPFVDFFRISILNTFLTLFAFLFVYPLKPFKKK